MSTSADADEPAGDALGRKQERSSDPLDDKFFALSGGILRKGPSARASNRFEGLLGQMVSHPASGTYSKDIERNLEFLHISLQLDMLSMIAHESEGARASPESRRESQEF